jgi:hypothetical protein
MILKILGTEIAIGTANNVASANLVRIVNTGAAAVCNVAYANGTVYASVTVSNTESVVIEKQITDTVTGANMKAAPIAYRY